nr:histidine phosphatase family protein [Kutzneria albida]
MRLVLVRHGQTPSNVVHALDSKPPGPPLTEQGQQQAVAVGRVLAGEPVSAVYSSVAVRARQTAAAIAEPHGLDVVVVEGVHEVFVGDLECLNDEDSLRTFFGVFTKWTSGEDLDAPMPGGESANQALARFLPVVEQLRQRHADGVVVLVSHGAAIRLASFALADNIPAELAETHLLPNTGRVVLELDPTAAGGWRCLEWAGVPLG